MLAEPFSEESLYVDHDEQTVETAEESVESTGETICTNDDDDDRSKHSPNFKAIPVTTNKSELSSILGNFDRSNSNVSKGSPSSRKEEVPTERDEPEDMPTNTDKEKSKNIDNDPTMWEEDNQGIEENEEKVISKEVNEDADEAEENDDHYSLDFQTIPTKPKRSELSALLAKLDHRRSKDTIRQVALEESSDIDIFEDKSVVSHHTRITVESTDSVDSPNECNAEPLSLAEDESSVETAKLKEVAEERDDEVKAVADVSSIPHDAVAETTILNDTLSAFSGMLRNPFPDDVPPTKAKGATNVVPEEVEKSNVDSLSISSAIYQGFACFSLFALLGLFVATNIKETTDRALLTLDEDDKDIDVPSIECILEEASGTRMCLPKKRQRVKVRAFRGNATVKKSGLGKATRILKSIRKKTSSRN